MNTDPDIENILTCSHEQIAHALHLSDNQMAELLLKQAEYYQRQADYAQLKTTQQYCF